MLQALADRAEAKAKAELEATGERVAAVVADCTDSADCARLVAACAAGGRALTHVLSTLGGVDASSVGQPNLMDACASSGIEPSWRFGAPETVDTEAP